MFNSEIEAVADTPPGDLPVGRAAARLGVAASTLRTWERRYGLAPSGRSAGGHRRYTQADVAVLDRMHRLTLAGETPARAALLARRPVGPAGFEGLDGEGLDGEGLDGEGLDGEGLDGEGRPGEVGGRRRPGGPGGRVLAVPAGGPRARGLARAAARLDVDGAVVLIEGALAADGVLRTYEELIRPVLVAAGDAWARTGEGIEIEHLFSEATVEALRHHRRVSRGATGPAGRPVLLACAPRDHHVLPLHVLAAALAERSIPSRLLGSRVPPSALAAAASRMGARAVFVWAQQPTAGLAETLEAVPVRRPAVVVVVGGPGWADVGLPPMVRSVGSLEAALDALT